MATSPCDPTGRSHFPACDRSPAREPSDEGTSATSATASSAVEAPLAKASSAVDAALRQGSVRRGRNLGHGLVHLKRGH